MIPKTRKKALNKARGKDDASGVVVPAEEGVETGPELTVNGDFASGGVNWELGTGWSVPAGYALFDGTSPDYLKQSSLVPPAGLRYRIILTTSGHDSDTSLQVAFGGPLSSPVTNTGNHIFYVEALNNNTPLSILGDGEGGSVNLDKVSVQELTDRGKTNLYPNPELAGGAASGIGNNNPPTDHSIGFSTVDSQPDEVISGVFIWHMNTNEESGRSYLNIRVDTTNPDLKIGTEYEMLFDAEHISGPTNVCLSAANQSGVSQDFIRRNPAVGETVVLGIRFTPIEVGWTFQVRVGTGPTTNSTTSVKVSNPRLFEVG